MEHTQGKLSDEYLRWAYTAVTRAKEKLILFNVPRASVYAKLSFSFGDPVRQMTASSEQAPVHIDISPGLLQFMENMGLTNSPLFLKEKYILLLAQLKGTDIQVTKRKGLPYCEQYVFARKDAEASLTFWYNGKNNFTRTTATQGIKSDHALLAEIISLSGKILTVISQLEKQELHESEPGDTPFFPDENLKVLYDDLCLNLKSMGVRITRVLHHTYLETYTFKRGNEKAVLNFNYDSLYRFTSVIPILQKCNSAALLQELERVLNTLKNK